MRIRLTLAFLVLALSLFGQTRYPTVAVTDAQGSLYVGGFYYSTDGVRLLGYVAKYAATGDRLLWSREINGDGSEPNISIAIGSDGNLLVAVTTSSKTLPVTSGAYSTKPSGVYLAKISADGQSLLAATYFGSSSAGDQMVDMKLDPSGNIVIAGNTSAADFPTTPGAVQREPNPTMPTDFPAPMCAGAGDQFVTGFDGGLSKLRFSTRLGTGVNENTGGLAIGTDGSLYVSGTLGTERGPCPAYPFLTKLTPDASKITYSTIIQDEPAVLTAGPVYVDSTGNTFFGADARAFPLSSPHGTVWKLGTSGAVAARSRLAANLGRLGMTSAGALFATAGADSSMTTVGVSGCPAPAAAPYSSGPAVISLDPTTLAITQARFVDAYLIGMPSTGGVITSSSYGPAFSVIPVIPTAGNVTCLVNAASYKYEVISPGEVLSLFGVGIGPSTPGVAKDNPDGTVGTSIGGVIVTVDGRTAPLLYAGPDQINFVAPFEITADTAVRISVWKNGVSADGVTKWVEASHPGLFRLGDPAAGQLAVLNQDGTVNGPDNPAMAGSIVSLFGTGFGQMTPAAVDGSRPGVAVNTPVAAVTVHIGDSLGTIQYIGNAPTLVQGVIQINVTVPRDAATGAVVAGVEGSVFGDYGKIYVRR